MNHISHQDQRAEEHPWGDAGQILLILVFWVVWIADSLFLHLSIMPTTGIFSVTQIATGIMIIGIGVRLLRWHTDNYERLGNYVVMEGPYRMMRHPVYGAVLLILLGQAVLTLSIASFGIWGIFFIFYNYIAAFEERRLIEVFGSAYIDYMRKVPRWMPRWSTRNAQS